VVCRNPLLWLNVRKHPALILKLSAHVPLSPPNQGEK
jgi:hypothetical protein